MYYFFIPKLNVLYNSNLPDLIILLIPNKKKLSRI